LPNHQSKNTIVQTQYDVIIIGGSYAGLAAAMSLGRSLRKVLVIDSGKPCNRFTPHSQNFITHDGEIPATIAQKAKEQVLAYPTVSFMEELAVSAAKSSNGFNVDIDKDEIFTAKKLLFATGVKDNLPEVDGLADCWGISVIHCPYCHGYEYREQATGILGNGDGAYHHALLVRNLTPNLSVFTNGPQEFTTEQLQKFDRNGIAVFESAALSVSHKDGYLNKLVLEDGSQHKLSVLYLRPHSTQHCEIPLQMGCKLNEHGFIITDMMQKTNLTGIYAAGDCTSQMRSVSNAVAQGNMAGAAINMELCTEVF
jgi:thioredoxin reductase